jgi:hypothetical protein
MSWLPVVTIHGTDLATDSVCFRNRSQNRGSYPSDFLPAPLTSA